jgi:hypothetical protein
MSLGQLTARLPDRSAIYKQCSSGLVVRWVTTSESPLLYVFAFPNAFLLLGYLTWLLFFRNTTLGRTSGRRTLPVFNLTPDVCDSVLVQILNNIVFVDVCLWGLQVG